MSKRRNKNKKAGPVKIIRPGDAAASPSAEAQGAAVDPSFEEPSVADEQAEVQAIADEQPAAEAAGDAPDSEATDVVASMEADANGNPATEEADFGGAVSEESSHEELVAEAATVDIESSEAPAAESVEAAEPAASSHEYEDASALLAQSVDVEQVAAPAARSIESIQIHDESVATPEAGGSQPAETAAAEESAPSGRGRKHDRKLKLNKLQKHARSEPRSEPEPQPEAEQAAPVELEPERRGPSEPRIAAFAKLTEYQTLSLAHVVGLPEETDVPGHWRGVGFGISGRRFVAGFEEVVEVIRMPLITHVPGTQPWMLGVANVRGTLLPVVDLKQFLEGERTVMYEGQRVMVVRQSGGNVAVLIDQLFGQRAFNDAQKVAAGSGDETRFGHFIKQMYRVGDNDWGVFSMAMLTRTPEFRQAAV